MMPSIRKTRLPGALTAAPAADGSVPITSVSHCEAILLPQVITVHTTVEQTGKLSSGGWPAVHDRIPPATSTWTQLDGCLTSSGGTVDETRVSRPAAATEHGP